MRLLIVAPTRQEHGWQCTCGVADGPVTAGAHTLDAGVTESELAAIRHSTYSGRPLGSAEFTRTLEKETKRRLAPQKRGPKKKTDKSENQETFSFGA